MIAKTSPNTAANRPNLPILASRQFLARVQVMKPPILTILLTLFTSMSLLAGDSVHDFTVKNIDGKEVALKDYKDKALLIVNVASQCGYTGQYENMQRLHEAFKDQGLVVMGFPANNYGAQEPGSEAEIKT